MEDLSVRAAPHKKACVKFALLIAFVFVLGAWLSRHHDDFRAKMYELRAPDEEHGLVRSFESWVRAHRKQYRTLEEQQHRFKIFSESWKRILKHNSGPKGQHYQLGLTSLADVSDEEFASHYVQQRKLHECWKVSDGSVAQTSDIMALDSSLIPPKQRDWRLEGMVSPVKNQGRCGSCWAFSAVGALEAAYKIKHGKNILLSEQQLLDCSYGYGDFGCNGGFPARAFEYIRRSGGLESQEQYPYEMASNGSEACRFAKTKAALKVVRVVNVTESNEVELERAVGLAGPVAVAFVTTSDFRLYSNGVFTTADCGPSRPQDLTHAVLAVGYGESFDGKKYWIIKNSWGEGWGIKGYFLMERGRNLCGIADCAAYAVVA